MERTSPRALRPFMMTPGYFMVRREPMLQSIHFTSAFSCASPRFVTRLKTLEAQFCTVMYWILAPFSATNSTTALWSVGVLNFGAVQPHVSHLRAFIGNDEGALELPEIFGVNAEVRLQR